MSFKLYIAEDSLKNLGFDLRSLGAVFEQKAKVALQVAASQAHGFVVQEVQTKLKGALRNIYLANLVGPVESGDNVWVVGLRAGAKFIEDGQEPHSMIHELTHGPKSRVNKKGQRYNIIPFSHRSAGAGASPARVDLVNYVKTELKKRGLDRVLKDTHGNALTGKVATLSLTGPGSPWSRHNTPLLSGLTIYQHMITNQKTGKSSVRRDVMTFRTVSESQEGTGKWWNKGRTGVMIFKAVERQVDEAWSKMMNELVKE